MMRGRRSRRQTPAILKFFITIVALTGVSLAAAFAWQNAEDRYIKSEKDRAVSAQQVSDTPSETGLGAEPEPEAAYISPAAVSSLDSGIKTASEAAKDMAGKNGGPADGETDEIIPGSFARDAVERAVPSAHAVDYKYFDDAIFFGDSISTGIPLYMKTMVPNTAVVAVQGVSPQGANSAPCIDVNGTRVTMIEAAKTKGTRAKVYIMLGANALDSEDESFIDGYRTFIKAVKELYPDALIYVQSMLPVTSTVNNVYPSKNINNSRINALNGRILEMALEEGVYYVDVAQCMVDADGMLPKDASPLDGMHLTPEYYMKWFDYLRTHTVSSKKS